MLCILKRDQTTQKIIGWIIATDCADARRQAISTGEQALADMLYRMEGPIEHTMPAQQDLALPGLRYTMLRT